MKHSRRMLKVFESRLKCEHLKQKHQTHRINKIHDKLKRVSRMLHYMVTMIRSTALLTVYSTVYSSVCSVHLVLLLFFSNILATFRTFFVVVAEISSIVAAPGKKCGKL